MKLNQLSSIIVIATMLSLSWVKPVSAHHSFAMFDKEKSVTIKGSVSKFEWTNPHAFVIVEAFNDKNEPVQYTLECSSPNLMSHKGWKVNTMKAGDSVTVIFHPLRDGKPGGMLASITLPSGTVMNAW